LLPHTLDTLVDRLHWLIATRRRLIATNRTQRRLAGDAVLSDIIIYRAAFCAISTH
jgi:hypothetical protein